MGNNFLYKQVTRSWHKLHYPRILLVTLAWVTAKAQSGNYILMIFLEVGREITLK